jgi:hypothetical protein
MICNTPILFINFNRPLSTQKVLNVLSKIQPKKLYVSADGPRYGNISDELECEMVKNLINNCIDWECELIKIYHINNLGCKQAVELALSIFFENEEMGIILEDDTLPTETFFVYATKLLTMYKNNDRIFSINGCNLGYNRYSNGWGFTNYFNMWGWATWKRSYLEVQKYWGALQDNNLNIEDLDIKKNIKLALEVSNVRWVNHWKNLFSKTLSGKINTWDYQWVYTCLMSNRLVIRPYQNYVINLGFNGQATHTKRSGHILSRLNYGNDAISDTKLINLLSVDHWYEFNYAARRWMNYTSTYKKACLKLTQIFNISKIKSLYYYLF